MTLYIKVRSGEDTLHGCLGFKGKCEAGFGCATGPNLGNDAVIKNFGGRRVDVGNIDRVDFKSTHI